jgi:hypothetical protein
MEGREKISGGKVPVKLFESRASWATLCRLAIVEEIVP